MTKIEVVAGIIFNNDKSEVLLALRKPEQHQGDRWEFPGGKLSGNENQHEALARELLEELNVSVTQTRYRRTLEHEYPDKKVCLYFWDVLQFSGTPKGMEGQRVQWVPVRKLADYTFPDANKAIVTELMR